MILLIIISRLSQVLSAAWLTIYKKPFVREGPRTPKTKFLALPVPAAAHNPESPKFSFPLSSPRLPDPEGHYSPSQRCPPPSPLSDRDPGGPRRLKGRWIIDKKAHCNQNVTVKSSCYTCIL